MQEIDPYETADITNDARWEQEQELSPEAEIIAQNVDPAVMNSWENEIVFPSPRRQQDDGGPAIII